jgi:hypothetical protein
VSADRPAAATWPGGEPGRLDGVWWGQLAIYPDDRGAFRVISNHLDAATCLIAQEGAYSYAQRLYPRSADTMKKPPYLIWSGPGPTGNADV